MSTSRRVAAGAGLAALYFAVAKLGLHFGALAGNVTPVWPPTGLAIAALVLGGRRLWPSVFVGALLVNGLSSVPFPVAAAMATGNTLEAVLGAYLLCEVVRFRPDMDRLADVAALAGLAAGVATTVSATIGVAALRIGGVIPATATWRTWWVWWVGDALGALVVAPLAFAWRTSGGRRALIGAAPVVAVSAAASGVVFLTPMRSPYVLFPPLVWAAVWFRQRGATVATATVSVLAVAATASGSGPFSLASATNGLWRLDTFLAAFATTGMVLAAIVAERDKVKSTLDDTRDAHRDRRALQEAQRVARMGSWEWDVATDRVTWSDEMCRLFGVPAGTPPGTYQDYLDQLHPDDRALAADVIGRAYESGEPFSFEHRVTLPDGTVRWLQGRGQVRRDKSGAVIGMHGTALDISELRLAEAKYEALLESAPDGIVVIDHAGTIRVVNRQTEALFGYSRSELVGQQLEFLIPERFRQHHPALRSQYHHSPKTRPMGAGLELAARRRDGSEFPVDISLSPLETEDGVLISAAIRDVTDRRRAEVLMAHQATHDGLTGLPNRALLADRLSMALTRAERTGGRVAVIFLDVDRFKVINDSLGHSAGDQLLRTVATRLMHSVRASETVARFGGDEFVIVSELEAHEEPTAIGERIAEVLRPPVELGSTEVGVTVSVGIAVAAPGDAPEALLRDADAAMYRAKEQGRARWIVFDTAMRAVADQRLRTENALRRAIESHELVTYYQPVVELTTGHVVGVEALARWNDRTRGIVLPGEFVGVAEETGMIVALGEAVLREACHQMADWNRSRGPASSLSVAVNLSARQLLTPGLTGVVNGILAECGLDPRMLCLEITESVLLDDADASARVLNELKESGVRIGVDDFGTGYSSLTYLKRFPVDSLKIDKSFLDDLGNRRGDGAIVAGLIDLAHAFSLTTIAEGVETDEQLAHLQALGCEQGQGHRWSRALPANKAWAWIDWASRIAPPGALASTPRAAHVLVVDDDRVARSALRAVVESEQLGIVVAEAADGREAVALARHHQPDVVVLDLAMPGVGGLEALPLIRAAAPGARIIVLSALDDAEFGARAARLGATHFLSKADGLDRLGGLIAGGVDAYVN